MLRGGANQAKYEKTSTTVEIEKASDDGELIECVRRLERRERLFATYIFDGQNNSVLPERVLEFMNQNLTEVFTCKLQDLRERKKDIALVAVHAFYCSNELQKYQRECSRRVHLLGDLLVCYILRLMKRVFKRLNEHELEKKYSECANTLEDHIVANLQTECRRDDKLCDNFLNVKYTASESVSPYAFQYLLDLAMIAKCEKVLNHSNSRRFTNERWTPCISIHRYHFLLSFLTVVPICFIKFHKARSKGEVEEKTKEIADSSKRSIGNNGCSPWETNWRKLYLFYSSPCSNFFVHTMFYFAYILLYAAVLIHKPRIDFENLKESFSSILLYFWQATYIVEMVHSCSEQGFAKFISRNTFDLTHNSFNFSWMLLWIISSMIHEYNVLAWIRAVCSVLSKLFFLLSFIFSAVRAIRVFSADSFFGSIVVMVKKMVFTLWSLFIVILIFWCTYAIAMISMLDEPTTSQSLLWRIFSNGAFEIFGEVRDSMRNGEVEHCPLAFNSSDLSDFNVDCMFRAWTIPILLFTYALVSSVLLVNLVTSFFSNTFDEVQNSSMITFRYKQYQRLYEYERKCRIPAPLSLFYYFFLFMKSLIRACGCLLSALCQDGGYISAHDAITFVKDAREKEKEIGEKYKSLLPACIIRPTLEEDVSCGAPIAIPENLDEQNEREDIRKRQGVGIYYGFRRRNRRGRVALAFVKVKQLSPVSTTP